MAASSDEQAQYPRVAEFYHGKSVFMTGAAGYLGVLILETLLELCPGIKKVYILLRARRGVLPEKRKEELLQRSVFDSLRENNPEVFEKVQVVSGDASVPDLGMSEEDLQEVIENASVVFHIAASVSFVKSFKYTLLHNVMSTQYAIDICRKLKKLDAFVYTSSAYGNSNRDTAVQEEIYRLPFHAQKFLDEISYGTDESLDQLASECFPPWPNYYTFSKNLAENVIQDNASDLPVIIIRPSIIGSVWKRPLPGYIEETSGITMLTIGVGKGFLKVLPGDPDKTFDFVPGDISAATHVIAGWSVATKRSPPLHVINNTSCVIGSIQRYIDILRTYVVKVGTVVPNGFRISTSFKFIHNPIQYKIMSFYEHYVPAYCFDMLLKMKGSKLRLVRIYKMADKAVASMIYFMTRDFIFKTDNFHGLLKQLQEEDLKLFKVEEIFSSGEELAVSVKTGAPFLQWKVDKKSKEEREKVAAQRLYLTYLFQGLFLLVVASVLYITYTITTGL